MAWTAPKTWAVGEVVTASNVNTHLRDNLKAISDPWTSYTPTFGNVTGGAGTFLYSVQGKLLHLRGGFSAGTATAAGSANLTIPSGAVPGDTRQPVHALNGATLVTGYIEPGTSTIIIWGSNVGANFGAGAALSAVRFTATLELG